MPGNKKGGNGGWYSVEEEGKYAKLNRQLQAEKTGWLSIRDYQHFAGKKYFMNVEGPVPRFSFNTFGIVYLN
jgi:hypothetical protein